MSKQAVRFTDSNGNTVLPECAESGSNYLKMSDGTLFCWGRVDFPEANSVGVQNVVQDFPVSFLQTPKVIISMQDSTSTSAYVSIVWVGYNTTASTLSAYINRLRTGSVWYASYFAIGRWK